MPVSLKNGRDVSFASAVWLAALAVAWACSSGTGSKAEADLKDTLVDARLSEGIQKLDARLPDGIDAGIDQKPTPLPTMADLTPGGCGAAPYEFLAPQTLGKVIDFEFKSDLSIKGPQIDALAAAVGVTAFSPVPYDVRVYRMRYTTQDRGKEVEATGLMVFPVLETETELPTAVWLHQTTGMEDFCAPSGRGLVWAMPAIMIASLGQVVVAPDYIGQNGFGAEATFRHHYLMGEPAALGTLDSVRALWAFADSKSAPEIKAIPSHTVALAGGSQGGNVALWAQRYADAYLPEATIEAVVALAPPSDLVGMLESGATTVSIGGVGMAMVLALALDWYQGAASLEEVLTPEAIAVVENIFVTECPKAELPEGISSVADIYSQALIQAVSNGTLEQLQPWYCYVFENSIANTKIPSVSRPPILYLTGEIDDVSIAEVQRDDVQRLCGLGYQIEHVECAQMGHFDSALHGIPVAWKWIQDRRAGLPIPDERLCVVAPPMQCEE